MEYPKIIDETGTILVELTNAYEIWLKEELRGKEVLSFNLHYDVDSHFLEGKWKGISVHIKSNALVKLGNRAFRIKNLEFRQDDKGLRWLEVEAPARWYDFLSMPEKESKEFKDVKITDAGVGVLDYILEDSGWTVGTVDPVINIIKNFKFQGGVNYLEAIRDIERVYEAEVVFDTLTKTVGYKIKGGVNQGRIFERGKDLQIIEITEDSSRAIYRLYPYGRRGLDISSVNAGLKYLDAPSPPYMPPPSLAIKSEEIEDPTILKTRGEALLTELSKPQKSYNCKVIDLSQSTPPEPFPVLGELVTIRDIEIDFDEIMRVVELKYYQDEPFNSVIILSTIRYSLLDIFAKYGDFVETGRNYWETVISDYDGALIKSDDGSVVADQWGLNTAQYKKFPNQAFNSSFEVYDTINKPDYWDTSGVVTNDARFDLGHSLQLTAGQYAEQKEVGGVGLPDPAWWGWCPDTRYSFRCRGHGGVGKIRVRVYRGATLQTIWTWREKDGSYAVKESGTQLDFDIQPDWNVSLITFACSPTGTGKLKLRIDNIHATRTVFIDAVVCEPDINKRWPSDYTSGPKSMPATDLPSLSTAHVWAGDEFNKALAQAPPPSIPTTYEFLNLYRDGLGRWRVRWRDIERIIRDIAERPPGKLQEIYIDLSYTFMKKVPEKNISRTGIITTQPNENLTPENKRDLAIALTMATSIPPLVAVSQTATITTTIITSVS